MPWDQMINDDLIVARTPSRVGGMSFAADARIRNRPDRCRDRCSHPVRRHVENQRCRFRHRGRRQPVQALWGRRRRGPGRPQIAAGRRPHAQQAQSSQPPQTGVIRLTPRGSAKRLPPVFRGVAANEISHRSPFGVHGVADLTLAVLEEECHHRHTDVPRRAPLSLWGARRYLRCMTR